MGAQTRSSAYNSPVKTESLAKCGGSQEGSQPVKLFILPNQASSAARFLFLKHPAYDIKKRFYFCPSNGLFELKKVSAPTLDLRSILFAGPNDDSATNVVQKRDPMGLENDGGLNNDPQRPARTVNVASGYVNKAAELFIATPFDMVFILIPLLRSHGLPAKPNAGNALFRSIDDILDPYFEEDRHLRYIIEKGRPMLESAAAKICDVVEAGDERMFRLNNNMLFMTIFEKARNTVKKGFPASLEENFVKRALEKPVLSIKREEILLPVTTELSIFNGHGSLFGGGESQSSTIAPVASTTAPQASLTTTVVGNDDEATPDEIIHLQRLKTAWSFITSSYLSNQLRGSLTGLLSSEQCPVDFSPLETYLGHLNTLRTEALASRTLSGFGQKRSLNDEDASETRAEKKRKQEEAERRKKAGESRGLRDLKKVDISGMKKMSAFFTKTSTPKVKP